ncbi:hypothetical protein EV1_012014 [Malus domestica]
MDTAHEVVEKFFGASLVGKKYEPLFDYFVEFSDVAFRVVVDNYVTDDSGTGIVHRAPAFGEEDYQLLISASAYVKDADKNIIEAVKAKGRLVKSETRSRFWGTPLPVWISEDGEEIVVMDFIRRLEELSGVKVFDLHCRNIDHITISSSQGPENGVLQHIHSV